MEQEYYQKLLRCSKIILAGNKAKGISGRKKKLPRSKELELFARTHQKLLKNSRLGKRKATKIAAGEMGINERTARNKYDQIKNFLESFLPPKDINHAVIESIK